MDRPIIVPLDTSVLAGRSLSLARALARQSGAGVHLVRIEPPADADVHLHTHAARKRRRESWESYLDGMGRYFFSELGAHRVRTALVRGERVVDALAAYARERNARMIVLAANGLAADGYARGVETAERLAREAGVPVLAVRPADGAFAGGRTRVEVMGATAPMVALLRALDLPAVAVG